MSSIIMSLRLLRFPFSVCLTMQGKYCLTNQRDSTNHSPLKTILESFQETKRTSVVAGPAGFGPKRVQVLITFLIPDGWTSFITKAHFLLSLFLCSSLILFLHFVLQQFVRRLLFYCERAHLV